MSLKLTVCESSRIEKIREKTRLQIVCPEGYQVLGFYSHIFDANKQMVSCIGRTAVFDLVARENVGHRFELPRYVVKTAPFVFWLGHKKTGFVEFPLEKVPLGVQILFTNQGGDVWKPKERKISGVQKVPGRPIVWSISTCPGLTR
jgi:hypothetical protein